MPEDNAVKFWEIKAEAGSAPGKQRVTLLFYGDITMYPVGYFKEDRSPYEIAEELKTIATEGEIEHITARINSPGGSAFGGLAIGNLLRNWPAPVTTHVDGLAGSAATLIFAAGDERVMAPNTLLFVHRASTYGWGNAADLAKVAEDLKTIDTAILSTYKEISNLPDEQLKELMDGESFISAPQAKEWGFATSIDRIPIAASMAGPKLRVNGLEFDPAAYHMTLTDDVRAALLTDEAQAAADAQNTLPTPPATDGTPTADGADADEAPAPEAETIVIETMIGASLELLELDCPELMAQIRAAAREEGIQAERARQAEIDALAAPGVEALITQARAEGWDAGRAGVEIVKAMKASGQGAAFLAMRADDAESSGANKIPADVAPTNSSDDADRAKYIDIAKSVSQRMQ